MRLMKANDETYAKTELETKHPQSYCRKKYYDRIRYNRMN